MPIYEYRCKSCEREFEKYVPGASTQVACPACASEQVMRRLTDLELDRLPTAGPFARVSALVRRGQDGWFHVHVQQELGHYVAEAVVDAIAGLEGTAWH